MGVPVVLPSNTPERISTVSGSRRWVTWICRLDPKNPQVASRLARCFDRWKKFDPAHQAHAQAALRDILTQAGLSADVREVVGKALA